MKMLAVEVHGLNATVASLETRFGLVNCELKNVLNFISSGELHSVPDLPVEIDKFNDSLKCETRPDNVPAVSQMRVSGIPQMSQICGGGGDEESSGISRIAVESVFSSSSDVDGGSVNDLCRQLSDAFFSKSMEVSGEVGVNLTEMAHLYPEKCVDDIVKQGEQDLPAVASGLVKTICVEGSKEEVKGSLLQFLGQKHMIKKGMERLVGKAATYAAALD